MKDFYKLVLVTQKGDTNIDDYFNFLSLCIENGVKSVQLREKNMAEDDLLTFATRLKTFLSAKKIPLIVNDNVDLMQKIDAAGVHLGQTDGDIIAVRHLLGDNKIIGLSVDSLEQLEKANDLPVDYVGIGAIFHTDNKLNVNHVWGCKELENAKRNSKHKIVAIGGIDLDNVEDVLNAGADGVAAIGVFHNTGTPDKATRQLSSLLK